MSVVRTQRGASLIVVLLLLLVVTLLGLASMRSTLLQERMAGNLIARGNAFQVAEAVLREAEGRATSKPTPPSTGCTNGVCARHWPTTQQPLSPWQAANFWETGGSGFSLAEAEINGVRAQYVIEDYGKGDNSACTASIDMSASECEVETQIYRIVVRSKAQDGAAVLLQSLYEVP
ncbi:pilus assembly PilX family protein [Luteimonas sp. A537]